MKKIHHRIKVVPKTSWDKWGELTRLQKRGETTPITHWNKIFYGPFIGVNKNIQLTSMYNYCWWLKSQTTTWDVWNPCKITGYLAISTGDRRISAINSRMLRGPTLGPFLGIQLRKSPFFSGFQQAADFWEPPTLQPGVWMYPTNATNVGKP